MTTDAWWVRHVAALQESLGASIKVKRYDEPPSAPRATGDWWRNASVWCMHLDDTSYLETESRADGEDLKRVLAWSIRELHRLRVPDWREVVSGWYRELSLLGDVELHEALGKRRAAPAGTLRIDESDGVRLLLLNLSGKDSGADAVGELRSNVEEVAQAYAPTEFLSWSVRTDGSASALLLCNTNAALDEHFETDEADGQQELTGPHEIRRFVTSLLEMLESDALVLGQAVVSGSISNNAEVYRSIAEVVLTWRQRAWFSQLGDRVDRVSVWGDWPLTQLLQSLPTATLQPFIDAVLRGRTGRVEFTTEVVEALQGLIAANLNISEAARIMYMHRNTLMNRIERFRQNTGYDMRMFSDALVLWLAHVMLHRPD